MHADAADAHAAKDAKCLHQCHATTVPDAMLRCAPRVAAPGSAHGSGCLVCLRVCAVQRACSGRRERAAACALLGARARSLSDVRS